MKLTSTRHKNIILRLSHGDIYSNDRLYRFGLIDSPRCSQCSEPCETITHRIIECPIANRSWQHLNQKLREIGYQQVSQVTTENILGAGEDTTNVELALRAELTLRLAAGNRTPICPLALVKITLKTISTIDFHEYISGSHYIGYRNTYLTRIYPPKYSSYLLLFIIIIIVS